MASPASCFNVLPVARFHWFSGLVEQKESSSCTKGIRTTEGFVSLALICDIAAKILGLFLFFVVRRGLNRKHNSVL